MQLILKHLVNMSSGNIHGIVKPLVFILFLLPLSSLTLSALNNSLGPNPAENIIRALGDWTLYFLLGVLAITPARSLFNIASLIRYRRMTGLFVFFYASLHFLAYIWFEQFFDMHKIIQDIIKRPFIGIGFGCFVLLIPLAITSTNKMMRRLGKNWQRLHRLVYLITGLALLHYFMMVKADYLMPVVLTLIFGVLMGYRFYQAGVMLNVLKSMIDLKAKENANER